MQACGGVIISQHYTLVAHQKMQLIRFSTHTLVGKSDAPLLALSAFVSKYKMVNQLNQRLHDYISIIHDPSISRNPHPLTLSKFMQC